MLAFAARDTIGCLLPDMDNSFTINVNLLPRQGKMDEFDALRQEIEGSIQRVKRIQEAAQKLQEARADILNPNGGVVKFAQAMSEVELAIEEYEKKMLR